mgnify:CR=1 FL=1
MQTLRHLLLLVLTLGLAASTAQAQTVFEAQLSGRNEVPSVISPATGSVIAVLTGDQLVVTGSFDDLQSAVDENIMGGAHLHFGYAGQNGGIAIGLTPSLFIGGRGGTFEAADNTFTLNDEQMNALMERRMYVNIHTENQPAGELRGQVVPAADVVYQAELYGSNEVPAVVSSGGGSVIMELDGDQLTVSGSFSGLDGDFNPDIQGGAHLHLGLPGQNGPIAIGLNATTDADLKGGFFAAADNTFSLSADQVEALQNRMMYVNIHSTTQPAGELRGQVTNAAAAAVFRAHLSGSNENPVVTSYGTGVVQVEIANDTFIVYGSFTDLESEVDVEVAGGAHLHNALAGTNGDISFVLSPSIDAGGTSGVFMVQDNEFTITPDDEAAFFDRAQYVNIHTLDHATGEIRGQLLPEAQTVLTAVLGGVFEAPPVYTMGNGDVKAELRGNELTVSGSFSNLSSAVDVGIMGGAHLHIGAAGSNGGIEFELMPELGMDMLSGQFNASENTFTLTDEQVATVLDRGYYVNIHTLTNGSGEIRGQLLQEARYYMNATLSGSSEVPAVNTPAFGQVLMEVESDSIVSTGSFQGLTSAFDPSVAGGAHLHNALAGANGGIFAGLNANTTDSDFSGSFPVADNTLETTEEIRNLLRERSLYVNIHTEDNQAGEIRGQTLPFATAYFTTSLDAFNEVPVANSPAVGGLKLELNGDELTLTGAFSGLDGQFDASIGGGAHLHIAPVGQNGGVDIPINADVADDLLSGTFAAADNTFTLTEEQQLNLASANYYANIHTTAFPGGELRGQILEQINFFPDNAPEIQTPVSGGTVILEGGASTPFVASWSAATDDEPLAYVWQLATGADFTNIILEQNVGSQLTFEADFGTVDDLLASLDVAIGDEATVYHRAVALDGAVSVAGPVAEVTIERGVVQEDVFEARLRGHHEAPPIATNANGHTFAALQGNELTVSGFFDNLSSKINVDIAGGAHLHMGYAGENGPVLYPLNLEISDDSLSAVISAEDNVFMLSDEEAEMLRSRRMYVNIHSIDYPGGELRGQLTPQGAQEYSMTLLGSNEVPSAVSSGRGALIVEIADDSMTVSGAFLNMRGDFDASVAGGAHLHMGAAGENGSIVIGLNATVDDDLKGGFFAAANNTFALTTELEELLASRTLYSNIHTTLYPGGELRGQVVADARAVFRAHLSGANEAPAVTSLAGGAAMIELFDDSTIVVSGTYNDLESDLNEDIAGGAHIHVGLPGQNGDVIIPLNMLQADGRNGRFLPEENTFTITEEQRRLLFDRSLYVNIHSIDEPAGEIRGQAMLESQTVFSGYLSGIFAVPEVLTTANGAVQAELSGSRMTLVGSFDGLSSPVATDIAGGAHIHTGYAGQTGDVIIPLALMLDDDELGGTFNAQDNTYELEEDQAERMRDRGYYVNIHSLDFQPGELRTQLLPEARTYFYAPLSGASEVPAVNTPANGALALEVNPGRVIASGSFNNLGSMVNTDIAGGAHIHNAFAGLVGPIAESLSFDANAEGTSGEFLPADNRISVSENWIDSLRERRYYVNVHSMDVPSGELRGQLLPLATAYFTNSLDGFNEVQPISSPATGGVKIELLGDEMVLTGGFSGLVSDYDEDVMGGSHLHIGGPGENGGIDLVLMPNVSDDERSGTYEAEDNTYPITDMQRETLLSGNYYLNIHTQEFPAGELRGQVLPEINRFPSGGADITTPGEGTMLTIAGDPDTPFAASWEVAEDRDTLAYVWQLAADEDFSTVLVEQNVGNEQTFETNFGVVDALLDGAGVEVGETITLYHRAIATDGSVSTPGGTFTVVLTRGMINSSINIQDNGLSMRAYPTVTQSQLTVELESNTAYRGDLILTNGNGQAVNIRPTELSPGTTTQQIDVNQLPAGQYQLQLVIDGQLISTSRFIVQ